MTETQADEQKGQILIFDDSQEDLQLLAKILVMQGYSVHSASEGERVLSFIQSTLPDLILFDVKMPKMDGYQVCEYLKASDHTHDIPIIFMTGLTETQDKVKGFQLGAVDYITKPVEFQEVLARIKTHLAGEI